MSELRLRFVKAMSVACDQSSMKYGYLLRERGLEDAADLVFSQTTDPRSAAALAIHHLCNRGTEVNRDDGVICIGALGFLGGEVGNSGQLARCCKDLVSLLQAGGGLQEIQDLLNIWYS